MARRFFRRTGGFRIREGRVGLGLVGFGWVGGCGEFKIASWAEAGASGTSLALRAVGSSLMLAWTLGSLSDWWLSERPRLGSLSPLLLCFESSCWMPVWHPPPMNSDSWAAAVGGRCSSAADADSWAARAGHSLALRSAAWLALRSWPIFFQGMMVPPVPKPLSAALWRPL